MNINLNLKEFRIIFQEGRVQGWKNIIPGGNARILNANHNEFYTKSKHVKNEVS